MEENLEGKILEDYADKVATGGGAATVKGYDHVALNVALEKEFGENIQYIAEPSDVQLQSASCVIVSIGTYDSELLLAIRRAFYHRVHLGRSRAFPCRKPENYSWHNQ